MFNTLLKNTSLAVFAYILVFLLPFTIYSVNFAAVIGCTLANFYTIFLFPIFLYVCLIKNRAPNITMVGYLHLLFIFVVILGALFAIWKWPAIRFAGAYFIEFFLVFVYTIFFLRTREQIEKAVYVFIIVGVINALMGWIELGAFALYDAMVFPPFVELFKIPSAKSFGHGFGAFGIPGFVRMFGFTHEDSNYFGPFTIIPFGLSAYCAVQYKKLFFKVISLFLIVTIAASASRSGYFGAINFFLFACMFIQTKKGSFYPLLTRPYLILGGLLSLAAIAYISARSDFFLGAQEVITDRIIFSNPLQLLKRSNPFVSDAMSGSWLYFKSHVIPALEHGFDNFGLGMGAQNFDNYLWKLTDIKFGSHSNFILFIGDTGYWGLLVQIPIVILTIRYGLKAYFKQAAEERDHLPLFLTAVFVGLVATGFVRTHYMDPYSFVVGGMIVKLYILSWNRGVVSN